MIMTPLQSWATMLLLIILVILVTYLVVKVQQGADIRAAERHERAQEEAVSVAQSRIQAQLDKTPLGSLLEYDGDRYLVVMVTSNRVGLQDYWNDVYYEQNHVEVNEHSTPVDIATLSIHERTVISRITRKYLQK